MSTEKTTSESNESKLEAKNIQDVIVETKHTLSIASQQIQYTVRAGTIVLKEEFEKSDDKEEKESKAEAEKPKASIFFISYTRDDVADPARRPITFSFNGGPGSSSVWLHLGMLGPRRVLMDEEGNPLPPPGKLVDNEYSFLDITDLVFIDPVSTGYSRAIPGETPKQFHGFKKDIESVGDFIRLYTTRYQRWLSPKFLIGESYGTTRAAGLSGYLQDRHGMYLNGIMLVSVVLNFQTLNFAENNDLPYILFLPTYTATAWYHHKLPPDLQQDLPGALRQVEEFAINEYTRALFLGDKLPEAERSQVIQKMARFTGLGADYIERTNLRVEIFRFTKELLRSERRTVGRLDSRFKGIDRDAAGENFEFDPSLTNIIGPYTAAFNDYVRRELNFESDLPYEILSSRVRPWSYAEHQNQYVDVAETLRKAMTINPSLKIYVANGFFDLATPYFATQYTFNHLGLEPVLSGNIRMSYFEAGHMMYVHLASLARLKAEISEFVASATK